MSFVVFLIFDMMGVTIGAYFAYMSPDYQFVEYNFALDGQTTLTYGVSSYYSPLSQIAQIGRIGLFDSNCYHLCSVAQRITKNLNFLYYDCFDYDKRQITKNIRFTDYNEVEHLYSLPIDIQDYESSLYCFQIIAWPGENNVQIYIYQAGSEILFKEIHVKYPFFEHNLTLTIGGGVYSNYFFEQIKFSYFPGYMRGLVLGENPSNEYKHCPSLLPHSDCNSSTLITYKTLLKEDLSQISTDYQTINQFTLAGWIKINQIVDGGKDFTYKLLKLTTHSQNSKLTNDNLSPFNLLYFFSNQGNQIIFTTYSYTFPYVNIDFTNNPYLITHSFDISTDIMLWHYIKVQLSQNLLSVAFQFYDEFQTKYEKQITVRQFQRVIFSFRLGNIEGIKDNYLEFTATQFQYSNCDSNDFFPACDGSCLDCNGPTSQNCLSCSKQSNRIYLKDLQQCHCPYNTVDNQQCLTHQDLNFNILPGDLVNQKSSNCPFGYFEIDSECFIWYFYYLNQSPSIINSDYITCLECLTNPQTWIDILYCSTSLISDSGAAFQEISETKQYFIFDGIQANYCQYCTNICSDQVCISNHFNYVNLPQKLLCSDDTNPNCYLCDIAYCKKCDIAMNGRLTCVFCEIDYHFINGHCVISEQVGSICLHNSSSQDEDYPCNNCQPPYYLTSDKRQCKQCSISNCFYCFQYQTNDRTRSTLYKDFNEFEADEFTQTGCSLCYEGFNFDFNTGKCVYGQPKIQNCLRSFVDVLKGEICLLSSVNDFNIAPQIIDCQIYIPNCEQCILSPNQILKCIICTRGYSTTFQGSCELCEVEFAIKCVNGDYFRNDYWVELIQSFLVQFLPDKYFYSHLEAYQTKVQYPLLCEQGYNITKSFECAKYCDPDCIQCKEVVINSKAEFICQKCPASYFGLSRRSVQKGSCLICPQLCQSCQVRNSEQIAIINSDFVVKSSNVQYTYHCLQAVPDERVIIDSRTQIAKYCFDDICAGQFEFEVKEFQCRFISLKNDDNYQKQFYETQLDVEYCNKMGISIFSLKILYLCEQLPKKIFLIQTFLKNAIFSLQKTKCFLSGTKEEKIMIDQALLIQNFDIIEWQYISFQGNNLELLNNNKHIQLNFQDSIFLGTINDVDLFIKSNLFQNVTMKNIKLLNLNLANLVWLDYNTNTNNIHIVIEEFIIENCFFENVTLFSFHSFTGVIQIQNFQIIESKLLQTNIFSYNSTNSDTESCYINQFIIQDCNIQSSTLFLHNGGQLLELRNLFIQSSILNNSVLIQAQCNTNQTNLQIIQVTFISSIFFKADVLESYFSQIYYNFQKLSFKENYFYDSTLLYVHSLKQIRTEIRIFHSNHVNMLNKEGNDQSIFLYDLKGNYLVIEDINISNSKNLSFFNIGQTEKIEISDISYTNQKQTYKIQLNLECHSHLDIISPLLRVKGFGTLSLERIEIRNQFSVDNPIIDITSDLYYQIMGQSIIKINQIEFSGNILIKKQLANVFSLLVIYQERPSFIILSKIKFDENFYNQLIDDPSKTGANLIFIDSQLSTITFEQINCQSNGLTNSSFSFIYANSLSLTIHNFTVYNSNLLSSNLWSKYYQIQIRNNMTLTSTLANKLIQQTFSISNIGGVARIIASKMYIEHAIFSNIIAESRSIFDITTQGQGELWFSNMFIENVQSSLESNLLADGCITISSQNSVLQLQAESILFRKIQNRLNSAIFTIYPSKKFNSLEFSNLSVVDCFSLMNLFISAEFSKESISHIIFYNLFLNNSEVELSNYLEQIQFPSSLEIDKIKSGNAIFYLINCDAIFENFFITGTIISPILILSDYQVSKVYRFRIQNLKLLYPFSILQFAQITQSRSQFIIQNLQIINAKQICEDENKSIGQETEKLIIFFSVYNCLIDQIEQNVMRVNQTIGALIASLNQDVTLTGSLIQISGLSQRDKVKINNLNIQHNICNFCYDGMVSIQSTQQSPIILEDLRCLANNINQFGCLFLNALQKQIEKPQKLQIKHSSFIANNGTEGIGVFSKNKLKMQNSVFLRNNGADKGGAIFLQDVQNDFQLKKCSFIENFAQIGGGIYLKGQNQVNKENFDQSLTLSNKAMLYSNNLVEAPDHLTLSINNQEMKAIKYQIINQSSIFTTSLYLPSGQEILNYKIFDIKNRVFIPYINEISVAFKNSLNEELIGDNLDECSIYTNDLNGVESGLEYLKLGTIKFNSTLNKFDIGGIKISFSPYNDPNQYLIIQIKCTSNIGKKQLNYQINAKTFNCQLGEFFSNNQCLICEPSFGFYSVTLNATQCSIFDETKFEKITSNQIKLKPRFWRSSYTSNSVELCLKNQQYCQGGWGVGNDLCFTGHIGGLCEECDTYNIRGDGSYFKTATLECGVCTESSIQKLPFIMLVIWSFISMLLTLKSNKNTSKTFANLRVTTQLYEILFKLTQNFESILFKMFLNYLWIFSAIFTFNITFDFSLSAVDSISTPSASVASNLDCELSQISDSQLIYVRLIGMFIFILFQILVVSCGLKIYQLLTESPFEYSIITNSFLYLFISNQSAIIKSLSSLIAVRTISEREYIQGNVSLEFYKDQHIKWILYFILPCLLIFAVIIPLTLFLILFFNKQQFNQINFRKHLGYLFNEYNKENQFWEQTRTLQRTIIIIFLTTFETNVYLKACLISLTVHFYQVLAQIRQPYIIKSLNKLDIESGQLIQIVIFSASIKYNSEQNNNTLSSRIMSILIILLMLQLCQSFIIRIMRLYFKKYYLQVLLLLQNISLKLGNVTFISNFLSEKCRDLQMRKQKLEQNFKKLRSINSKSSKQERKEAWATTKKFYVQSKYQLFIPKSQK